MAVALALAVSLVGTLQAEAAVPLRVLSWNVWGVPAVSAKREARMAALPDAIATLEPDVVLLQELWTETDGATVSRGLERHGYRYATHLAHTDAGMTGLFAASKLPLESVGFVPFASGQVAHSFWHLDWMVAKGVASFLVETSLGQIEVQNTHLHAQYVTDDYAAERLSQASQVLLTEQNRALPLVLGGDFNTGAEELPRQTFLDLGALRDTTPSPLPDTIFVRDGASTQIRVVATKQALTEAVRLDDGVATPLSDHPAIVVDLELSTCSACAPAALGSSKTRETTRAALLTAAAITPWRVSLALASAAGLLAIVAWSFRCTRARPNRTLRSRIVQRTALALLATGFIWSTYLGAYYYPQRAEALRFVVRELEALPPR